MLYVPANDGLIASTVESGCSLPTSVAMSRSGVSIGGLVGMHHDLQVDALGAGVGDDLLERGHVGAGRADAVGRDGGVDRIDVHVGRDVLRQERDDVRSCHRGQATRSTMDRLAARRMRTRLEPP